MIFRVMIQANLFLDVEARNEATAKGVAAHKLADMLDADLGFDVYAEESAHMRVYPTNADGVSLEPHEVEPSMFTVEGAEEADCDDPGAHRQGCKCNGGEPLL